MPDHLKVSVALSISWEPLEPLSFTLDLLLSFSDLSDDSVSLSINPILQEDAKPWKLLEQKFYKRNPNNCWHCFPLD